MAAISAPRPRFTPTSISSRDILDATYRRPELTVEIEIGPTGRLTPHPVEWWDYWRPLLLLGSTNLVESATSLRAAWENYITSGFDEGRAREYCRRYFALLNALLAAELEPHPPDLVRNAIRATVGFECAVVIDRQLAEDAVAAVTTTARNPVYLLTRLKWPDIPHSTRFVPLVTLNGATASMFGHYRRYALSEGGARSLLVYPRNTRGGDVRSLQAISYLANALGTASDPFVADRAGRLWEHILQPLLEQRDLGPGRAEFDFIDIGGGTGALAASLCGSIAEWSQQTAVDARFSLVLVDVCRSFTASMLSEGDLARRLDRITRVTMDYRRWLATAPALSPRRGVRFGLACKVFDMASQFVIRPFAPGELPEPPADPDWFSPSARSPITCLAPSGPGPEALMVSPLRFQVEGGHVFAQPALSDYFSEFAFATGGQNPGDANSLSLPLRVFDPSSLVTSKGRSVLAELLQQVDYLLVEDADLRPQYLLAHLARFQLSNVVAYDMTEAMRLTGNYAYVLVSRSGPRPRLDGEELGWRL